MASGSQGKPQLSKTKPQYFCKYCHAPARSSQGLNSHMLLKPHCCAQLEAEIKAKARQAVEPDDSQNDIEPPDVPDLTPPPLPKLQFDFDFGRAPSPANEPDSPQLHHATVEEQYENPDWRWVEEYPGPAGRPKRPEKCETDFEQRAREAQEQGLPPWHPFESLDEWEFACWFVTSGTSQGKTDALLKLNLVSQMCPKDEGGAYLLPQIREKANPAFHNNYALLKRINALPVGVPWTCTSLQVEGDLKDCHGNSRVEQLELWHRNPVDLICELMQNPSFKGKQSFAPQRVFMDNLYEKQEYSEMWTGSWWWDKQGLLPEGATIAPVILSSDKTNLTRFSGDKQAWPVYLSIGNIAKDIRCQPSARVTVLLAYIPVSKLKCFSEKQQYHAIYELFHKCMRIILKALVEAGLNGVDMTCADGFLREVYPLLAAYITDYPEQCLVVCCKENSCPICQVDPSCCGDIKPSILRDPQKTLAILRAQAAGLHPPEFKSQQLRLISPFWSDLPHCDILECITPDLLHQLHKGVFKDHTVKWATEAMKGKADEVDAHFVAMSRHSDLCHFKNGISLTSQWTGTEHKNMEKVFLGILAGQTDRRVIAAVWGILDFIYYSHFETHNDDSLDCLKRTWTVFHENKDIFVELDIREHFNISKLHNIMHYPESIRSHGTTDGYNTESSERLHIDLAKSGYLAGNKKEYIPQMTEWLQRQEAVHHFETYLQWAVPGYQATQGASSEDGEAGVQEQPDADESEDESESAEDPSAAAATNVTVHHVAKTPPSNGVALDFITKEYGALELVRHLNTFLEGNGADTRATTFTRYPLYKRAILDLPPIREVSSKPIRDRIYAVPGEAGEISSTKGIKQKRAARFSTALLRTSPANSTKGPMDGISIGEICLIFELPPELGTYHCPLVYVHWFKDLKQPEKLVDMYKTSFSSDNRRPRALVVPLDTVLQSCHLIPVYGARSVDSLGWASETVLHKASEFYLNPYLRHYDFYWLRYRDGEYWRLELARRERAAEAERNAEVRRAKNRKRRKPDTETEDQGSHKR